MPSKKIVLDTNCLLVSISKYGEAYPVWRGFLDGRYTLCVSTEILEEYEEIIASMATPDVARNVVDAILKRRNVERIDPYYHWNLITADPDDNKFVDCAFASQADFIVTDDGHFAEAAKSPFPLFRVMGLDAFAEMMK